MAEEKEDAYTIVEYMRDHSGYKCGYCKSKETNFSHGMWTHKMSVGDYQELIDRGWRRSGKYCYKPTMEKICCPMYTIKCDALELKLSKTQKKVLKRMHRYLSHGDVKGVKTVENDGSGSPVGGQEYVRPRHEAQDLSSVNISSESLSKVKYIGAKRDEVTIPNDIAKGSNAGAVENECASVSSDGTPSNRQNLNSAGNSMKLKEGPDPSKPPCRKAKELRRERREAKLAQHAQEALSRGESPMETKKNKKTNVEKNLEDFLNEPLPANPAHTLELKLVRVSPPEAVFMANYNDSYAVFRKYQLEIHHDSESECDKSSYQGFLVDGPLSPWKPASGPELGYGSFHHQYWLDGRLIAVGVLDILPHCVSSVYLFYDPEFSYLSLGTYASIRELALTRDLQCKTPDLKWYYMGFYIHSCPKMRYKGRYTPSFLLCPETYAWVPIEKAVPKLDVAKYARFNDDLSATDDNGQVDIHRIPVLHQQTLIPYGSYHQQFPDDEDEEEVKEYAAYVGAKCAYNMFLYRS